MSEVTPLVCCSTCKKTSDARKMKINILFQSRSSMRGTQAITLRNPRGTPSLVATRKYLTFLRRMQHSCCFRARRPCSAHVTSKHPRFFCPMAKQGFTSGSENPAPLLLHKPLPAAQRAAVYHQVRCSAVIPRLSNKPYPWGPKLWRLLPQEVVAMCLQILETRRTSDWLSTDATHG